MFKGSIVALITPFRDGQVDEDTLRKLVDWHVEMGTHGIVPCGTTGESPTLSHEEHGRVVEIVVDQVSGRIPVIAGAGSNNTAEAVDLTLHAQKAGADGVLHVAGYYNRPNQEGLYQHFKAVHDASDIPIIVYNIPPRAIVDILPATMSRLAELPRIVGVKDATGDVARVSRERLLLGNEFCHLSGEDGTALAYNAQGGNGCISVSANVAPRLCAEFQEACLAGKYDIALVMHERLMPLHVALFLEPSPAGVKYAASRLGLCEAEARLPVVPLTEGTAEKIDAALANAGLIN
ncbi:MAG: 4-hydroxy-tetrahydrodipicolinate synthase, partial [Rhodospirillaceae bacterium]|jgi:4-hydroxy-tetrahydrodipicolinate synthase|nr:4-hydroxy-tetrahydrodipicolinate synthase [Rhodospirillaceae bacterium]MBT4491482.1 4-hydroxy-tetrahydrodipicolinate synthase [Rhodospirillaceae bacterium]MBT5195447.1 4-hydroxy-tetrahydrodipicolinate synthase [Rhodospirillaceae bacterium]MBT5896673.1 4-hydroxy-tetrahydrodipicolinate synthase [Rhodospirillaceae bacterium]MBT6428203.1 4-hydroxy-tetrahydrodipicolinate synthase [Rhodospirillaceae bacterium]